MHLKGVLLGLAIAGLAFASVADARVTERVSVDSAGGQANSYSSEAAVSADGRFVAFRSFATNLVPGDTNGREDVFVRDLLNGTIERVSVDSAGEQADGSSVQPAISADGRFVAFASWATNLVATDTNDTIDVFVHDRLIGTTRLVSVDDTGTQANSSSLRPAINADGRFVAFDSSASNLVPADTNGSHDVFIRDRIAETTERVSLDSTGTEANLASGFPAISADGRFVAFESAASNLTGGDTNLSSDIFVRDRQAGTTERASIDSKGGQAQTGSFEPAISGDGRVVVFTSYASNLVPGDSNGSGDIFVRDRQAGTTERASVDSTGGQAETWSVEPALSVDGRVVVFTSYASNLVPGDSNGSYDIFVRDREAGTTDRLSVDRSGQEGDSASYNAAVAADARLVAFESYAANLVTDDTNGTYDIFVATLVPDRDGDGVEDAQDNCPDQANADQQDTDGDGTGDACDRSPRGPQGQIADLLDHTLAALDLPRLAPALKSQLEASLKRLLEGNKGAACNALRAYELLVQAAPRNAFSADEKAALVAESRQIRSDLACA
jgi:Tol biopolymer transport system component